MDPLPASRTAALVRRGTVDAELAALVSILVEARVPVVVSGPAAVSRDALADALVDLLPSDSRLIELAGPAEEFEWMPEAVELGWRRERNVVPAAGRDATARASSATTVLLARDLAGTSPRSTAGARARLVLRALGVGYGLVATMSAPDLDGVFTRLHDAPASTTEDERTRLGVVLVVDEVAAGSRVLAAHYVRPLARDQHGHVQRLPPAVLATWNAATDRFDHFAWGILPELAMRIGRRPIELEREQARRATDLRRVAAPIS